jgi:hypothetical protein
MLYALHDPNNSLARIDALVWLIPVVTVQEPDYRHPRFALSAASSSFGTSVISVRPDPITTRSMSTPFLCLRGVSASTRMGIKIAAAKAAAQQ